MLRLLAICSLLGAIAAPACGGNSSDPHPSSAGSAGRFGSGSGGSSGKSSIPAAGTAGTAPTTSVECGSKSCAGLVIPFVDISVPACCASEATNHCGLDTFGLASFGPTFPEPCQPLAQPGTMDPACPESTSTPVDLPTGGTLQLQFPGCCRANHTCGYNLDKLGGVYPLGLGCVDATPFLAGEAPQPCGETGAAGAGGDSNGSGGEASLTDGGSSGAGG
ncbi:MAG TPA: hypothetical protein VGC79_12160 [Polyangiaceae bacterium]